MQLAMMVARIMYSNGVGKEELRNRLPKERGTQPPGGLCPSTHKLYQPPLRLRGLHDGHQQPGRRDSGRSLACETMPTSDWAPNPKHLLLAKEKWSQYVM